jgi:phosphatidylserine/phosphatidylglycerophosphate/cardiolipin synthase-like enzyme
MKAYYSGSEVSLFAVVREYVINAKERIWIEMFDFSSDEVIDILKRVKERNKSIDIRILLDMNDNNIDKWTRNGRIKRFEWADVKFGNPVYFWAYHLKLGIVDDIVLFGSANWSYSGLLKNREGIMVIDDKSVLKESEKIFLQDWNNGVDEIGKRHISLHDAMKKFIVELFR